MGRTQELKLANSSVSAWRQMGVLSIEDIEISVYNVQPKSISILLGLDVIGCYMCIYCHSCLFELRLHIHLCRGHYFSPHLLAFLLKPVCYSYIFNLLSKLNFYRNYVCTCLMCLFKVHLYSQVFPCEIVFPSVYFDVGTL